MSLRRLFAVARKEVIQILRDSRSLMIVVIMPVTLMLLGYGVNLDLKGLPIYVFDRDGSQQSQDLLKHFQASEYFKVERVVNNYAAITRALDDGHAKMGIVIPWDFSSRISAGGPVPVQALVDGTDDNTANVLIGYVQAVVQGNQVASPARPVHPACAGERGNAHMVQRGP
jgi:ABC-2 type transport system permease protein